jgi:signal transduction histidine kinase
VLGNLLSNAIKYSPAGGEVRFTVTREEAALKFVVADQGIGIPEEDLPRLFSNFHRASNVSGIPGTGLGLSIVKRAIEAHGGQISVHSEAGRGTTFAVFVPLTR